MLNGSVRSSKVKRNMGFAMSSARSTGTRPSRCRTTTRGTARRYDHIFASDSLVTDSVGYFEDWMTNRWSDHAAIWARFKVR